MHRIPLKPEMLRWAHEGAGIEPDALGKRSPRYRECEEVVVVLVEVVDASGNGDDTSRNRHIKA